MKGRKRRSQWLVLGLISLTAAACFWQFTLPLDRALQDLAQRSRSGPGNDEVVVVAIDDASIEAIGHWPWSHGVYAQALRQLAQFGPRAVMLNLLLTEADPDPAQDERLAEAMQALKQLVVPAGILPQASQTDPWLRPTAALQAHSVLAHADAFPDDDGVIRRAALWAGSDVNLLPHPALALLGLSGAWPPAAPRQPELGPDAVASLDPGSGWHRQAIVAPDLSLTSRPRTIPMAALLRNEVPASWLHDRIVLIGVTAQGIGARLSTPISPGAQGMAGVELIARTTQALAHGWLMKFVPPAWTAAVSASMIATLLWALGSLRPGAALLACASLAAGALGLSWALLLWVHTWWPPFALVLSALCCFPVWSWRRLEETAHALEDELQTLTQELGLNTKPRAAGGARVGFMQQRTDAITEANAQLRKARALLADTLAALPDAVWVLDAEGRITQSNRQALKMTSASGATAAYPALEGLTLDQAMSGWTPKDAPSWSLLLRQASQRREPLRTEANDGKGAQCLVSLLGNEHGHIVCATDVTALGLAERQRTELLGFIAHDIRSPQASLISLVELHRLGGAMPQGDMLSHVESMARQTLGLCEELLQVMRAEIRALNLAEGDLITVAESAIAEVMLQARTSRVELLTQWPPGSHVSAHFDDYLLHRAMVNLLSNAIKFSPAGGHVRVSLLQRDDVHVLSVEDQGPGIPESELGRLFNRYERVEQGRPSRLPPGIGLGLVFIDTVARRHGGRVNLINTPGVGARFELCLPIEPRPVDDVAARQA